MKNLLVLAAIVIPLVFVCSCSQGGNPVISSNDSGLTPQSSIRSGSQTHLWGYYDIFIDIPNQTATAVLNRELMFTANVVTFLNGKPTGMGFHINGTPSAPDYVDVDIDVTLTHPFPGLTQYNGYDVRGVFMGDGSASMNYNPDLIYPVISVDQFMLADPVDHLGGPDGYTRWFNRAEFSNGGMPLLQYTQGKLATPAFNGSATLCPYKYFADYLSKDEDLWTWMNDPGNQNPNGVFGAGQANTRNYYLRFPNAKGVKYGYAVIANWEGTEPENHPSNAPEALAVSVIDDSTVFYISPTVNGGSLKLDISLWDWDSEVGPSGIMDDYRIFIESTVLNAPYEASTSDMTPIGGGEDYSTYHVEIPADNVLGAEGNDYWVIAECADEDYTNAFNVLNDAWDDPLAAFFRFDLQMSGDQPPTAKAKFEGECGPLHFMDDGSYDVDGTITKYEWDWDNDGVFDEEGADVYHSWPASGDYAVQFRVTDNAGLTDILDTPLAVHFEKAIAWAKTWGAGGTENANRVTVDSAGNVYIACSFTGNGVDFDPSPGGSDIHNSNGGEDVSLTKIDVCGDFVWARTWGSSSNDNPGGVAVDDQGNVYVYGAFNSIIDLDPGLNTDSHTTNGGYDCFVSKFNSAGDYVWGRTWGGGSTEYAQDAAIGPDGSVFVTDTWYSGSMDMDPGPLSDIHNNCGGNDVALSKFNSNGDYVWGRTWGGPTYEDGVPSVVVDPEGNSYVGAGYKGSMDMDPGPGVDTHNCGGWEDGDAGLSKFDSIGNYVWGRTWGTSVTYSTARIYGVSINPDGGFVYSCGFFGGPDMDFDPGAGVDNHSSNGADDCFVSVFDTSGNFQWARTWGGTGSDECWGVATDASDSVYVVGHFSAGVDFDPGAGSDNHSSSGAMDAFVTKYDSSGTFQWARTWGSSGNDLSQDVVLFNPASIYICGYFEGTVDFDPGVGIDNHVSNGGMDAFLCRYLPDGNW